MIVPEKNSPLINGLICINYVYKYLFLFIIFCNTLSILTAVKILINGFLYVILTSVKIRNKIFLSRYSNLVLQNLNTYMHFLSKIAEFFQEPWEQNAREKIAIFFHGKSKSWGTVLYSYLSFKLLVRWGEGGKWMIILVLNFFYNVDF